MNTPTVAVDFGHSPDGPLSVATDIDTANAIHAAAIDLRLQSEVTDAGNGEGAVRVETRDATEATLARFALLLHERSALTDAQAGQLLRKLVGHEPPATRRWIRMMESKNWPTSPPPPSGGGLDGQ
jgi:hypothetical protein